ncbi:MAG: tRNA uracil 4-sulfurtransferase ThiI [Treponema sp.]|nr:tRNA 4-thiouridine(8) synthase ThiI [Spirochaetia bacterium]MDY2923740.1 tRNA uracil 4-sulfurtransferase ThiI [Treponema sp.]
MTYLAKIGELSLKKSNIKEFERRLCQNTQLYLETVNAKVKLIAGRLYIECDEDSEKAVEFTLNHLIGITGWAKAVNCEKTIEAISQAAYDCAVAAKKNGAKTFKIDTRRPDKSFPMNSYEVNCEAAGKIDDEKLLAVDVHKPDAVINIEIREKCYVYCNQNTGCRGLPVGSSGRGLLLLSGGLDSPVAGYRMMRRGMYIDCAYFHSYPYTSEEAQKKVETLAEKIAAYGICSHLHIIPFTDVQMRIKERAPQAWTTLMLRVCMMKAVNMLVKITQSQCVVTGESLGQVASQTIENMNVTEDACDLPLLRPLVGMDKEEIVETANFIDTYETSILPYEDCCVLFSPRHPVLRGRIEEAHEIYKSLEVDQLIAEAVEKREMKKFHVRNIVAQKYGTKSN